LWNEPESIRIKILFYNQFQIAVFGAYQKIQHVKSRGQALDIDLQLWVFGFILCQRENVDLADYLICE